MAQLVVGAVGAAVGFMVGGPMGAQVGWALGSLIGGTLAAPDQQGPRLAERTVQLASYGSPIAKVYGSGRLAGTLIWSTDIIEAASTESAKGGPEVTSYSYSVSCAVAICEGTIGSIRRIWADAKLVYDIRDGASGETQAASSAFAEFMTIYTGTEAQMPDATIESIEGAGNVEAFRGTAYVVFDGLPLGDYGNRIPNFTFEVSTNEQAANPTEFIANYELEAWKHYDVNGAVTAIPQHHNDAVDLDVEYVAQGSGTTYSNLSDAIAALGSGYTEYVGYYTSEENLLSAFDNGAIAGDARYVYLAYNKVQPEIIVSDGLGAGLTDQELCTPFACQPGVAVMASSFYPIIGTSSQGHTGVGIMLPNGGDLPPWDTPDVGNAGCLSCTPDGYGLFPLVRIIANRFVRAERKLTIPAQRCYPGTPSVLREAQLPGNSSFCLSNSGEVNHNIVYTGESNTFKQLRSLSQNLISVSRYPLGPVLRLGDPNYNNMDYWDAQAALAGITSDYPYEVTGAAVGTATPMEVDAGSVLLSGIVSDLCTLAGLTSEQIDVTALTDVVLGFTRGRVMSARAAIEVLRSAFYFDAVESGDEIRFVKRGAAPVATLTLDDVGAGLDASTEPLEHDRAQEAELPSSVVVAYQSPTIDFQTGVQQARRRVGESQQITQVELPIVMTDLKAAEVADVLLYDSWASRTRRKFSAGMEYAHLEPTDIVPVDDGAAVYELRIVDKTEDRGVITFDCRDNDAASYSPNSTPAVPSGGGSAVRFDGPSKLYLLDIPLLSDANDDPGYYMAATGYLTGWRGAEVFRSANDGASYTSVRDATARVIAGQTDTVLGDYSGGNTVDEINSVDVTLLFGELASITRDQLLNSGNAALLGNELIQFQRATLQTGSTYRLTGLLRGRKGTEQHMATHAANERFVLISASTLYRVSAPLSEIEEASVWKGVTFGSTLADSYEVDFTNSGVGAKPLAPAHLNVLQRTALPASWFVKWIRRTRIGGYWSDNIDAPIGEVTEAYDIEVTDNAGLVRHTQRVNSPEAIIQALGSQELFNAIEAFTQLQDSTSSDLVSLTRTPYGRSITIWNAVSHAIIGSAGLGASERANTLLAVDSDTLYLGTQDGASPSFVKRYSKSAIEATSLLTAAATYTAAAAADVYGIAYDGTYIWAAENYTAQITKLDAATLTVVASYAMTARGIVYDAVSSAHLFVNSGDRVTEVDPASGAVVREFLTGASSSQAYPGNGALFVLSGLGIQVFDIASGLPIKVYPGTVYNTFAGPMVRTSLGMAVACPATNEVLYINDSTGDEVTRFPVVGVQELAGYSEASGTLFVNVFETSVILTYGLVNAAMPAGSVLKVYQVSSVIGRGFPAIYEF